MEKVRLGMDVQGVEVARLRTRDTEAFRRLIERLQRPITRHLYRLVGDQEVAQDLAQDTFLQVYQEIEKTSVDLALDAWIYRNATIYGLLYLIRKRLHQFVRFSFDIPFSPENMRACNFIYAEEESLAGPSVEDQAEMRLLIEEALALLGPKDATCLQLHYCNGFTYEQIGKIVDITPEGVRKRVARGVEKFRAVYGR